jgi:hypothetical protein
MSSKFMEETMLSTNEGFGLSRPFAALEAGPASPKLARD